MLVPDSPSRFTSLFASGALEFRTGDPRLIRDGRVNRLVIDDTSVSSFNLQILGALRLVGPVEAGFNLDLVGFSFGPRRAGDYGALDDGNRRFRRFTTQGFLGVTRRIR